MKNGKKGLGKMASKGPSVHSSGKLYSHSAHHEGPDAAGAGKAKAGGKPHKAVSGPDSSKESKLGSNVEAEHMKYGHKKLEKVPAASLGKIQPSRDKSGDADSGEEYDND